MGEARSEPPPHVWDRISETLKDQGLTAGAAPKSAALIRRSRNLRIGYASAAAAILIAALLLFNPRHTDTALVADNLTQTSDNITNQTVIPNTPTNAIATQDNRTDGNTPDGIRAGGKTDTHIIAVIDNEYFRDGPPVPPVLPDVNIESVGRGPDKNAPATTSAAPERQWADRSEIELALQPTGKNRGANGMSLGLYSSNIGSRSSEKIVQSTPYAKVTSSFVAQESSNSAFNTFTQASTPTRLKHRVPLSAGISVTKPLAGRLSLESGITYSYLYSKGESSLSGGAHGIREQHLHYLGIPIGVKYDVFRSRHIDLYASAAGLFEMCAYSKLSTKVTVASGVSGVSESESLNVRGIQPSIGMRVGIEAKLSRTLGIYLEPGLSYYFDTENQPESFRTENPLNFAFSAGLRINFK